MFTGFPVTGLSHKGYIMHISGAEPIAWAPSRSQRDVFPRGSSGVIAQACSMWNSAGWVNVRVPSRPITVHSSDTVLFCVLYSGMEAKTFFQCQERCQEFHWKIRKEGGQNWERTRTQLLCGFSYMPLLLLFLNGREPCSFLFIRLC